MATGTGHAPAAWRRATCQCRHATEFLLHDLFFLGRRTNRRHADRAPILLGLAAPGCSSHAACRCGRLPAKRAPPKGPGSSPRQRFDHRRRQPDRDQSRDAHAGLPRKLDLDRRCRRTPGVISGWRDQNLSETIADPKLPAPAINLARANLCPTSDSVTTAPGARLSATIARFCSALQHRRRSGPVMTSTLAIAPSLTPVQTPSLAPVL